MWPSVASDLHHRVVLCVCTLRARALIPGISRWTRTRARPPGAPKFAASEAQLALALVLYKWVADAVVLLHLSFLVFLAGGSLLAWRWPKLVWLHVPAVVWAVLSISVGLDCPLTPLEKHFRMLAGEGGYAGGFIDHYIEGVIYPERFTLVLRLVIAGLVLGGYAGRRSRAGRTRERIAEPEL